MYHKYFPQWDEETQSGRLIKAVSFPCITLKDFKEKRGSCDSVHMATQGGLIFVV
jgi:hypothetical protein